MNIRDYLKENIVYLDGAIGTLLQKRGLRPGEKPETWNVSRPSDIIEIEKSYFEAGSNVILTNTFGANCFHYGKDELCEVVVRAVENARRAAVESSSPKEKFVALDIGPLGKLLKPYGNLDFEDAVKAYAETIRAGVGAEPDLIFIETMNDSLDTKAALLAAKENSDLPVFVSNAYGADGKLMTGASPAAMVAMLEGLGADAIGVNCSLGPKQLKGVIGEYLRLSSLPVIMKPNAGLPREEKGVSVYDVHPEEFSEDLYGYAKEGVRILGGCCGTSPDYIRALTSRIGNLRPIPTEDKGLTMISSYTHAVFFGETPVLIGERINPTGKKRFKEALRNGDIDHIINEGIRQQERGAHVLDVNVGIPEIDEPALLKKVCFELQAVSDLPLQIDTTDIPAMEGALRAYNGKPMINSVNGREEVMRAVFPLAKKYGGLVVCLTLDEDGIPEDPGKRVEIAKHITEVAAEYGISKKDLIFDTLAMAVSADNKAALSTLEALRRISEELGCLTSLGVSNVSFGLPNREIIASSFFTMALEKGLNAAIMNPDSDQMMRAYYAFRVLKGLDESCADYIENIGTFAREDGKKGDSTYNKEESQKAGGEKPEKESRTPAGVRERAIIKGLKNEAGEMTEKFLKEGRDPLEIIDQMIIPALDVVGRGFENNTMFLPQLLMSAEASRQAFLKIKERMKEKGGKGPSKGKFVLATVRGDIHDIGKNIVRMLLENYGFEVIDLGKDVKEELVVETVIRERAPLVGLSALMTTTVPAMEETIKLLKEKGVKAKVIVGGAVLTGEYADRIGADFYAKDAMATVRYALGVLGDQEAVQTS